MPGPAAACATFSSCNKAGSIPMFTAYLQQHPNNYTALTWRGRAHSIIGNQKKAIADFERAGFCSTGARKCLAQAHVAELQGKHQESMSAFQSTVRNYPTCAEAWSDLGTRNFYENRYANALPELKKAVSLGKEQNETDEPWYPWSNNHIGDIYYLHDQVDAAKPYYSDAVKSCGSLTIAHLGLSKCNIIKHDERPALENFRTAKSLNPNLVKYKEFEDFKQSVSKEYGAIKVMVLEARKAQNEGGSMGGGGGGSHEQGGANGGGGNFGGDGGDGGDGMKVFEAVKKYSPQIMKSDNAIFYVRVGKGDYWLSRDKAGHGGSFCKLYEKRGNTLHFFGSVPINIFSRRVLADADVFEGVVKNGPSLEDFEVLTNKHESRGGTQISFSSLNRVK